MSDGGSAGSAALHGAEEDELDDKESGHRAANILIGDGGSIGTLTVNVGDSSVFGAKGSRSAVASDGGQDGTSKERGISATDAGHTAGDQL